MPDDPTSEVAPGRGQTAASLQRGADLILSETECLIMAWRRGGHEEYKRVRKAQYKLKHPHDGR